MVDQEPSLAGQARKLEITPKTTDQIRSAVVQSAFVSDATPEMITNVSCIQLKGFEHNEAFLAETTNGLNIVVNRLPSNQLGRGHWFIPYEGNNRGFYLEGFFEEKRKRVGTPEGVFEVKVFTGPDRFNQTMATLGRRPGIDSFRLIPIEEGKYTAKTYAEHAARLEIPVARLTEEYVEHDLKLNDHLQAWWSMPTEIALHLQKRAAEVVASGDDARIDEFSDGLDKLSQFSVYMVPLCAGLLDNDWNETDSVDERIEQAMGFIKNFADPVGDEDRSKLYNISINEACLALVETGLLEGFSIKTDGYGRKKVRWSTGEDGSVDRDSPELLRAKHEMTTLAGAYARNIVNMFSLAGERQGITERADPRRGQLIERLMTRLEPDAVAAFINKNQSVN